MALKYSQKGMTLLEVLVAMTLMVIISAISYASLNGLINAKLHTDNVAQNIRKELLTSQQLTKDFHSIINRSIIDQRGQRQSALIGRYAFIEFSRNGNTNILNQHRSDLQRVQWLLRDNVVLRRTLNYLDAGSYSQWTERNYLTDVKEFSMVFVNQVGQEFRHWPVANQTMPLKAVKLTITLLDETVLNYNMNVTSDA